MLVISDGNAPGSTQTQPYCAGKGTFRTICFHPQPYSTRGEARFVARLARRRGWRRVVIVTSTYHVTRARMIFRRCVAGDVDAVGARPPLAEWATGVAYEWAKLGYALTLGRRC